MNGNNWLLNSKRIYFLLGVACLVIMPATLLACFAFHLISGITCAMIVLVSVFILALLAAITRGYQVYQKQEKEIQMYKIYTKPLEELTKEIRARQHEFDNHLNAILNMHIMVDNYDELVRCQSEYIFSVVDDKKNSYLPLLRISDKILAGFLYTKLVSVKKNIDFEIEVENKRILTNAPENDIIEVVGTLIDNAIDACDENERKIRLLVTSIDGEKPADDRLVFEVMNEHPVIPLNQLTHFFDKGYSTKSNRGNRGFGLYNARRIVKSHKGNIMVENRRYNERNYVCFHIEM